MLWLYDQLDRNIQRCDNANRAACNHSSPRLVSISRVKYGYETMIKHDHEKVDGFTVKRAEAHSGDDWEATADTAPGVWLLEDY